MRKSFTKPLAKITTSICIREDQLLLLKRIKAKEKIPVSRILEQVMDIYFEKELLSLKPKKHIS